MKRVADADAAGDPGGAGAGAGAGDGKPDASGNAYAAASAANLPFDPTALPDGFAKIKLKSIVLATVEGENDGAWWPAVVSEVRGDGLLVLEWRDFEGWDPILRRPK